MNRQSEHLSRAQIENYGSQSSGAGPEADAWIENHLADCPSCRSRVLDFQRTHFALSPDPKVNNGITSDCPSENDLRNLAADLCSADQAAKSTSHAATCKRCGPLLQAYTEDFSDDFSPEERTALEQLNSASPAWQQAQARKMLQTASTGTTADMPASTSIPTDNVSAATRAEASDSATVPHLAAEPNSNAAHLSGDAASQRTAAQKLQPKPRRRTFSWKWITLPAAAAALIAFGIWYTQRDTPEKVEKLLAHAYTEQRTIEMRWPGSDWAKPQVTLGPSESFFSKSHFLFKAEDIVKEHETTSSGDLKWLRARAEVEILEGHSQSAIELLNSAKNPDSIPLLLDMALAYSQQFKRSQNPNDLLSARDKLNTVLKKDPENRTALFNLALAYADSEMWDQAISTWESYLRIDPTGPWAQEATEKLAFAKTKVKSDLQYGPAPISDVGLFLSLADNEVALQSEQYQQIALQSWLPGAVVNPESREHEAITRIANVSAQANSDMWWHDLLQSGSRLSPSAAEALTAASIANTKGYYAEAWKQSIRAEKIFRVKKNLAGKLRARYESVYAQRRLLQIKNCLARADPLQMQLAGTRYAWLQSQLAMERAVCLNLAGQLTESQAALSRSSQIARTSNLTISLLRSIGFAQGLDNRTHRFDDALREGTEGLRIYWTSPPSTERIYQLYAGFAVTAQDLHLPAEAEALMRHAVDILRTEPDKIQLGAALEELSKLLAAQKDYAGAEAAASEASQLFERESHEPTSRRYRLVAKIGLADLQFRQGKPEQALATLEPASSLLSETDGYFISLDFYRVSGNINLALHRFDLASSAYQTAILNAEHALSTLKTERERLDWLGAADDAYRGLVRVYLEQRNPENAWKLWEWYISRSYSETLNGPAYLQLHHLAGWPELWSRIASISWPKNGPTRFVYAVFNDGLEIWTVDQDKMRAFWVPIKQADLEQLARQFSDACANRSSPLQEVQRLGQDLYALLLRPVNDTLALRSVISIELDRPLSNLPIEALRSPSGWYLAEKNAVVYSPGVILEGHLRSLTPLSLNAQFLLADAGKGAYLPGHDLEFATISRTFSKLTVVGSKANPEDILMPLHKSAIFGFIGHAESHETGAGLRVNQKLLLTAQDFSPQHLRHVQLAVLAACSTGSSGADGLLDNRNLVHAFLSGGVPSVLATRWNVDAEATAILMSDFYDRMAHNEATVHALFSARNHLLQQYAHPYFWAAPSLTGKVN